jgi:hypothetical protein
MTPPKRHWRSYGNDPLPTGAEALDEPFNAFPSWFPRVTCKRCYHERMFSEVHSAQRAMLFRYVIAKLRHDGCGGQARKVELLTDSGGVSSQPVGRSRLPAGGSAADPAKELRTARHVYSAHGRPVCRSTRLDPLHHTHAPRREQGLHPAKS